MRAKGRKRRAVLSRDALLHEGTGLIKGPWMENKDKCDIYLFFCCCLKSLFDQEAPLRLRVSVKTGKKRKKT